HHLPRDAAARCGVRGARSDMDEESWLRETDTPALLKLAVHRMCERKRRLFACACARCVLPLVTGIDIDGIVGIAERIADNQFVNQDERTEAFDRATKHRSQSTDAG